MSQFITNSMTRRSFLRASGTLLSLPFLESVASAQTTSTTQTAAPKRMIFLGGGFGFTKQTFYPKAAGRFADIGLTDGLMPLERHINDFTMVSNLTNVGATNPHGGSTSYLTGANVTGTPGKRFYNSISCDQLAAQQLGQETRFASLVLSAKESDGMQNSGHGNGLSLSWDDVGKPMPGMNKPIEFYHKIFASNQDSRAELDDRLIKKQSILDIVRINASGMKRTLSKNDREKLDEYFQGLRQIEQGLQRQAKWADIAKPDAPYNAPGNEIMGEEEIKLMYDMMIIALQTDSTRVITYRQPVCSMLLSIGLALKAHSLSHYGFSSARRQASEQRDKKCMDLFAHFIDRLKEAKDVDGSRLYDNCIVSYGSNLRSGHELKNVPALLSGGGAQNIKHGSHIILPKKDTPLANYWLTLMQEAGVKVNRFSHSTGHLPELVGA
ncbi:MULTISPECIES: DUF1552 domain-containing protein [unclassified Lentimonas]|uniref:DUF1552 domain-containing protein n=1 Tax=unclassified Lentimonas TaxID=2630993 RepID=UPI00132B8AA5|nr:MULTISPECIES: DUF1552 domain-containing protein [unclassified Lentimonas]CAA6676252.1 Unannotated [Lentimonas sp. CC4]CAA6683861.1 Unannotated [Lentimonas sp. CC6]CAA6692744.1 Unannotated [Lentimonas sp. CC10]CAA6696690.1 Unannotated [Lentimonas sp. CC19]CAA7072330.1 Unannotated [Lentimonas sp. CC11]